MSPLQAAHPVALSSMATVSTWGRPYGTSIVNGTGSESNPSEHSSTRSIGRFWVCAAEIVNEGLWSMGTVSSPSSGAPPNVRISPLNPDALGFALSSTQFRPPSVDAPTLRSTRLSMVTLPPGAAGSGWVVTESTTRAGGRG